MGKNELEDLLYYLETTYAEPHDDYTSEFTYHQQKILWEYIKKLQEKSKRIDKALEYIEKGSYKDLYNIKSIDKLLNILKGED